MCHLTHKASKKVCRGAIARTLKLRTQEHFSHLRNAVESKGEDESDTLADAMREEL